MTYTGANHRGEMEVLWLHFWGDLMSTICIYIPWIPLFFSLSFGDIKIIYKNAQTASMVSALKLTCRLLKMSMSSPINK